MSIRHSSFRLHCPQYTRRAGHDNQTLPTFPIRSDNRKSIPLYSHRHTRQSYLIPSRTFPRFRQDMHSLPRCLQLQGVQYHVFAIHPKNRYNGIPCHRPSVQHFHHQYIPFRGLAHSGVLHKYQRMQDHTSRHSPYTSNHFQYRHSSSNELGLP